MPASAKGKPNAFQIPPDKIDAHGMVQVGGGSGFIVDKKGIILTNKHVIAEPGVSYTVFTDDDETYEAEVLARDPVNDVAILKINPKKICRLWSSAIPKKRSWVRRCSRSETRLGFLKYGFYGNSFGTVAFGAS